MNVREHRRDNQEWTIQKHKQHRTQAAVEDKQDNNNNKKTQKTKMRSNTHRPKNWGEPMCSRRVNSSCFLLDINHATHIAKSDKVLSVTEKEQIYDKVLSVTEKEQIYDKVVSVTEKEQQNLVSDRERTTKSCQ